MTSQVRYNTNLQMFLTQMLIYLYDNESVTKDAFDELFELPSTKFSSYMKEFKQIIYDLKMNVSLVIEDYIENSLSLGTFKTKHYHLMKHDNPTYFNVDELNEEALIKYSMTIVYLMLRNRQYVSTEILKDILPDFDKHIMLNMKNKLSDMIELDKNVIGSYLLLDED